MVHFLFTFILVKDNEKKALGLNESDSFSLSLPVRQGLISSHKVESGGGGLEKSLKQNSSLRCHLPIADSIT